LQKNLSCVIFERMKTQSPVNIEERKKLQFSSGDLVRVWSKIEDKGKTRLQAFEGMVLARKHGTEAGATFTIRKIASGVGVERIFTLFSPLIDKIELVRRSRARRSKLYYVREKAVKQVRRRMKQARPEEVMDDTTEVVQTEE
jgi:large subunit ribosomal protein L19